MSHPPNSGLFVNPPNAKAIVAVHGAISCASPILREFTALELSLVQKQARQIDHAHHQCRRSKGEQNVSTNNRYVPVDAVVSAFLAIEQFCRGPTGTKK